MEKRFVLFFVAVLALGALPPMAGAQSGPIQVRKVALTGDPAPGTEPGALFFDPVYGAAGRIDRFGSVGFNAFLVGVSGNPSGFWKEDSGTLGLVAREGQAAPGTGAGVVFDRQPILFEAMAPSFENGHLLFAGEVRGTGVSSGVNSGGVWTDASGSLALVARTGNAAPGAPTGKVFLGFSPNVNEQGHAAFNGAFGEPGGSPGSEPNAEGLWTNRSGTLRLAARGGMRAPGTGEGVVFGASNFLAYDGAIREWAFSTQSRFLFHGNLAGPGVDNLNDEGLWIETGTGLQLLVREGDAAPGFGSNMHFGGGNGINSFGESVGVRLSATGAVLFDARISGNDSADALYTNRSGGLQLIAKGRYPDGGDPAPGMPAGINFVNFIGGTINLNNRVAFGASTTTPQTTGGDSFDFGIWSDVAGSLRLVAADRVQVPGLPLGVVFGVPTNSFATFQLTGMSDSGRVAFVSQLSGTGVDGTNYLAAFLTDGGGVPRIMARLGDNFDVHGDGSELRRIRDLRALGVSGRGEVGLQIFFTDETQGFFVLCDALCQATAPSSPPPPPPPFPPPPTVDDPTIVLAASVSSSRNKKNVNLSWSGARTSRVDIFRDGSLLVTTANDGSYTDMLRTRHGTFSYKVCEEGSFQCSNVVAASF